MLSVDLPRISRLVVLQVASLNPQVNGHFRMTDFQGPFEVWGLSLCVNFQVSSGDSYSGLYVYI